MIRLQLEQLELFQKEDKLLTTLVLSLSPSAKSRERINIEIGRPAVSEKFKQKIIQFLEGPDISYCKPERSNTVYWRKMIRVIKFTSQNIYLLWIIKDTIELYNLENALQKVSYYTVQQLLKNEKHFFKIGESNDDYCRSEKCENVELLHIGVKYSSKRNGHDDLTLK